MNFYLVYQSINFFLDVEICVEFPLVDSSICPLLLSVKWQKKYPKTVCSVWKEKDAQLILDEKKKWKMTKTCP